MNVKDVVFTGGSHVVIWGTGASIASTLLNPEKKRAHPTNPVECCADANPKTMLPNDT